MPFETQRTHGSPTGAQLNLYMSTAAGQPRGVVHINHGFAEHAARYAGFADFLSQRGFHVYAHDHRGHGYTKAPDAPLGRFAGQGGDEKLIADIKSVHDLIGLERPGLPLVIFGHSMGGLIALNFVLRHSAHLHGAAIWNANFSAGAMGHVAQALLAYERFRLGSDMPSRLLPKLTFEAWGKKVENHRTLFDWLSHDPAKVDKYIGDPLCGWAASVSMWRDVFGLVFHGADDRNFSAVRKTLPFNLVGGADDPATDGGKAVEALAGRMTQMGFSSLSSRVYPQTRHECLNDLNRDVVMRDFGNWLDAIV